MRLFKKRIFFAANEFPGPRVPPELAIKVAHSVNKPEGKDTVLCFSTQRLDVRPQPAQQYLRL